MPIVTAIITTHKRQPEIVARALDSVLAQTHSPMEVIVVDDSPEDFPLRDSVRQMAEQKGAKYIAHQTCQGACAARNTGLAAAKGEFVAFLDDDDAWLPEKIQKQLEKFTDGIALVYCGNSVHNITTGEEGTVKKSFLRGNVFEELMRGNFIGSTSFPLLRRSCLEEIGGFDVLMQAVQDYDVWLRLAKKYAVDYVEEPLVRYYIHEGERISTNPKKRIAGCERMNEKNREYLNSHKDAFWFHTIRLAPEYAADGQLGKAVRIWLKAVLKCPGKVKENLKQMRRMISRFCRR